MLGHSRVQEVLRCRRFSLHLMTSMDTPSEHRIQFATPVMTFPRSSWRTDELQGDIVFPRLQIEPVQSLIDELGMDRLAVHSCHPVRMIGL